jgi:hypothetical protein
MALAALNGNFQKVGTCQLYLVAAPSADPGAGTLASTADGYYGLFYQDAAAKKVLKSGVTPYCNLTADGISQKVKPSTVEFDYNNGPKTKMLSGIDEASVEFSFYDVDTAHLKDVFGLATADLIAVAAAAGKAGRKIAAIGANANYNNVVAMARMASVLIPGEYDHFLWPLASFVPEIDVKLSKKDAYSVKVTLSLRPSPYALNAAGNGVIMLADTADAAAL